MDVCPTPNFSSEREECIIHTLSAEDPQIGEMIRQWDYNDWTDSEATATKSASEARVSTSTLAANGKA